MSCARCGWPYPVELLNPVIGSPLIKDPVCGICAREMIAAIHGVPNHRLRGAAEELRLQAVAWRHQHPNARPMTDNEAIAVQERDADAPDRTVIHHGGVNPGRER